MHDTSTPLSHDHMTLCNNNNNPNNNPNNNKRRDSIDTNKHNSFSNAPDYVAYPTSETDISELFRFAAPRGIAIVPFGGGSSVCGGVEAAPIPYMYVNLAVDR
jgi:FAD/FMN-containing dehydrogenase